MGTSCEARDVAPALTGGRGSQLQPRQDNGAFTALWRPPSPAGEDRNNKIEGYADREERLVAPALTGGRGSQPEPERETRRPGQVAPALTGG